MTAFYNEIDLYAAQWLRNLIDAGHIAPGVVDTRSILDIHPHELEPFTQCHFFAGIGVWSHALRAAGWPDDRPVWTGSCPCQPFSAAGGRSGFADERHLWPHFFHLIQECRPAAVIGEQVASKDAGPWIDLVQDDMEALGYAFGAIPFPSAGVGAPHIRDRLYWLADTDDARSQGRERVSERAAECAAGARVVAGGNASAEREQRGGEQRQQPQDGGIVHVAGGLADADHTGLEGGAGSEGDGRDAAWVEPERLCDADRGQPGPVNGFWRDADWLRCRDDKWRPVELGTFPLAHGAPSRVGRLRAYGNAINAEAARVFIASYLQGELT